MIGKFTRHTTALLCAATACFCLGARITAQADTPATIRPVAMGLGGFNYWTSSPFANSLLTGGEWIEFESGQWGNAAHFFNTDGTPNPQFNERGLPQSLNPGRRLRLLLWPYDTHSNSEPADWPKRGMTGAGKWVVTWQGEADIRLQGATFVAGESSGAATGLLNNGRRVYQIGAANPQAHVVVEAINSSVGLSDLQVWMPDPEAPTERSLEGSGQFWHPFFLRTLRTMQFGSIRFMDWGSTNASPQRDWSDRRRPDHIFQRGVLKRRPPADGFSGNRGTGMAYEHMVRLANDTGLDIWLCVPHMATDDYILNLARLLCYGSDGVNPYTGPQENPVHPPLKPGLRLWLEYSNEIWSNGNSFPQGNWAQAQAAALGLGDNQTGKARFNARRQSQIWSAFQQVFGGSERIVRVAAIWTANQSYTDPFLTELRDYGPTLSPAVQPDIVSPTTYYGNGIQDWAYEEANLNRNDPARSWFHTGEDFVHNTTTGTTRPVSKPLTDSYWTSDKVKHDLADTFVEWKRRIFSGSTVGGGGFDTTGVNGGFDADLASRVNEIFQREMPLVSYEGGPSLYTDYYDGGDVRDDGVSNFMTVLNRRPEFEEIYRVQLNMARSKGLASHGMFVDVARPGKYGQWGHLEYLDQPVHESPKWMGVARWSNDMLHIRNPRFPRGAVPSFLTPGTLPQGVFQQPYSADIVATGGDVAAGRALEWQVVGSLLVPGMRIGLVPGDSARYRLEGTPLTGGWSYVYLRVNDDDGDAAWKVFSMYAVGSADALVESNITGATTASSLPYTAAQSLDESRISWSGLDRGAPNQSTGGTATGTDGRGVRIDASNDSILFAVSQGSLNESDATLASAISDNEYFVFTVTPQAGQPLDLRNAEMQLVWERLEYHAPRNLAVFTSIGGFQEGQQVYHMPRNTSTASQVSVRFRLPATAAYENLTAPVSFRLYFHGSQYSHRARIHGIRLARDLGALPPLPPRFVTDPILPRDASINAPYTASITGFAIDPNVGPVTYSKVSGPAWLNVATDGSLSGTPTSQDGGRNTFIIRATDSGGLTSEATLRIEVPVPPIQSWRMQHFGTGQNTGIAANDFDADGDGVVNLLEYAFGGAPTESADAPRPQAQWSGDNLLLSFFRAREELVYQVQGSTDLHEWDVVETNPGEPGGIVDAAMPTSGLWRFVRIAVNSP